MCERHMYANTITPCACHRLVGELVSEGLLSVLANLADADLGDVSDKLTQLKDACVMELVREGEAGEHVGRIKI
jgi:hypothetical protein